MAEWLGNGLQNRVQQFDSAWYLKRKSPAKGLFLLCTGNGVDVWKIFFIRWCEKPRR